MKLPNKLYSYRDSVISKFHIILNALKQEEYLTINDLYINVVNNFEDIIEFCDTVECLYILGKIEYSYESRRIYYVV